MLILVDLLSGRLWCNDGRWRRHAPLGAMNGCLMFYQHERAAIRVAIDHPLACVLRVPDDAEIDASGRVTTTVPAGPGMERVVELDRRRLVVWGPQIGRHIDDTVGRAAIVAAGGMARRDRDLVMPRETAATDAILGELVQGLE